MLELGTCAGADVGVRELLQVAHGCRLHMVAYKVSGCTWLHAQGCMFQSHMPVGQVAWVAGFNVFGVPGHMSQGALQCSASANAGRCFVVGVVEFHAEDMA